GGAASIGRLLRAGGLVGLRGRPPRPVDALRRGRDLPGGAQRPGRRRHRGRRVLVPDADRAGRDGTAGPAPGPGAGPGRRAGRRVGSARRASGGRGRRAAAPLLAPLTTAFLRPISLENAYGIRVSVTPGRYTEHMFAAGMQSLLGSLRPLVDKLDCEPVESDEAAEVVQLCIEIERVVTAARLMAARKVSSEHWKGRGFRS